LCAAGAFAHVLEGSALSTKSLDIDVIIEAMERPFWEPIGHYVFSFGRLERCVDEEICKLLGIAYYECGQYLLSATNFRGRLDLLNTSARKTIKELEMKELVTELHEQNTFRNDVVHGAWTAHFVNYDGNGNNAWQKFGLSRSHRPSAFNVTIANLNGNAEKIKNQIVKLVRITREIVAIKTAQKATSAAPPAA
jgi:hypothetical protein